MLRGKVVVQMCPGGVYALIGTPHPVPLCPAVVTAHIPHSTRRKLRHMSHSADTPLISFVRTHYSPGKPICQNGIASYTISAGGNGNLPERSPLDSPKGGFAPSCTAPQNHGTAHPQSSMPPLKRVQAGRHPPKLVRSPLGRGADTPCLPLTG